MNIENRLFYKISKRTSIKDLVLIKIKEYIYRERGREREYDHNGITAIYKNEYISRQILLYDYYEHDILVELIEILNKLDIDYNALCIDIGANIGNHSVFLSQYFKKIVAFEPHPLNFLLLSANAFNIPGISVHNKACGSNNQSRSIVTPDKCNMGGSFLKKNHSGEHKIEVIKIDETISEPVSFIKIDVEGHELDVIKGAINTITTCRPIIAFEANPDFGNPSQVYDLLRTMNYKLIYRRQNNFSTLRRLINILFTGHKFSKVDYIIGDPPLNKSHSLVLAVNTNRLSDSD